MQRGLHRAVHQLHRHLYGRLHFMLFVLWLFGLRLGVRERLFGLLRLFGLRKRVLLVMHRRLQDRLFQLFRHLQGNLFRLYRHMQRRL